MHPSGRNFFLLLCLFFFGQARHLKHSTIVRPSSVVDPDLWAHISPPHLPWNASPANISSSQDSSTFPFLALACALDILLAKFRLLCWPADISFWAHCNLSSCKWDSKSGKMVWKSNECFCANSISFRPMRDVITARALVSKPTFCGANFPLLGL